LRGAAYRLSRVVDQLRATVVATGVVCREPGELVARHMKIRIGHAERCDEPLAQKILERPARDHGDEVAEHVGRNGVIPLGPGLRQERQGGGDLDDLTEALV
jgi:hypothetical protein